MNARVIALCSLLAAGCSLLAAGCSPIIGAECRADLAQCGGECVDLERDPRHCGGCDLACDDGQSCVHGACIGYDVDAAFADAGAGDAGASDASFPADAGAPDASNGPHDAAADGAASDGGVEPGCELGELRCGDECVRPDSDPLHCGGCGLVCEGGDICAGGSCADACGAPRMICDERCVDARTDPDHCGGCGVRCESGVCSAGECALRVAGHVVLVGHDYEESRAGMNRVAGNAVFLGRGHPVRVVAFEGAARAASIAGTDAAITQVAGATGRSWARTVASTADEVPLALAGADVFVLYAQADATDDELFEWGKTWGRALRTFLGTGGVVVVFDGMGANEGTYRALVHAGLLRASGRADASDRVLTVTSPGDAVALGLPLRYRGERSTVRFDTLEESMVVSDGVGAVVVHRTIVP